MSGFRMRVVLADGDASSQRWATRLLEEAGCQVMAVFSDGLALYEWLQVRHDCDAVFLEVALPRMSGMAILQFLEGSIPTVLVTGQGEHAVEAFDADAVDYLLKPLTAARLDRALKRVESRRSGKSAPLSLPKQSMGVRYPVQAGEGVVLVELQKTTHFEVENGVVWAHAKSRFRTHWKTLSEVETALTQCGLMRIHRHLLVRLDAVLGLRPTEGGRLIVTLYGGIEVESSRGGAPKLREIFGLQ